MDAGYKDAGEVLRKVTDGEVRTGAPGLTVIDAGK
jgi:hypothetical protein